MANLLLSGPAGANKSALARQLLAEDPGLRVVADFQAVYASLTLVERGPDGRYPLRSDDLLPLTEYVRRAIITGATEREIGLIATNSDGDPARRAFLLDRLGPGAVERIVDPGEQVVRARLSDPFDGALSDECDSAIGRWYGRAG